MPEKRLNVKHFHTDVLIIGGGTAGCWAAAAIGEKSGRTVLIAEKAGIRRSGCLAAGVNALNCYITEGHTPEDYVAYARQDGEGIVREDLVLTFAERVNRITAEIEKRGLVILRDDDGRYAARGWRNIKINGENIKPLLAEAALEHERVSVLEHVNITALKTVPDGDNVRVTGATGFMVREACAVDIDAKAVLIATGGAAGLYRPNNPGFSRHKMWYPPFNTGAGYAMGIQAGAEMTTMENRFVALRCKDTIAPTGTIAQGVHAQQINAEGTVYEEQYGRTTAQRIYGTVMENRAGRGPCFLKTSGISAETEQDLYKAYLNMAPSQTLKWLESGRGPASADTEIEGTEPYVTGGHTAGGFWVDTGRRTTLQGLYASGDVAGGAPQKYVTGALAEGEIAAESILKDLDADETGGIRTDHASDDHTGHEGGVCCRDEIVCGSGAESEIIHDPAGKDGIGCGSTVDTAEIDRYEAFLNRAPGNITITQAEEAMQKVMDEYAGGIRQDYQYNERGLAIAQERIRQIMALTDTLGASDMFDLLHIYEIRDRLTVCQDLIAHMKARKETRWHIFGENGSHPEKDERYTCYVNSRFRDGRFEIILRPLVTGTLYSHQDAQIVHLD